MFHVKQPTRQFSSEEVAAALRAVGVAASDLQLSLLARHAELVLEANAVMNLTRITDPDDVLDLHIQDSLGPFSGSPLPSGRIVDVGSGAGYPGIPLAIMGHEMTLCESVKKKAAFLVDAVNALGLQCEVVPLRAEELAAVRADSFSAVTARAVSALPALVELAAPLLSAGGCLFAMKGRLEAAERDQADRAAVICGMTCRVIEEYHLPRGDARTLCVYEKTGKPRIALPRRPGMAQRQTLGQIS